MLIHVNFQPNSYSKSLSLGGGGGGGGWPKFIPRVGLNFKLKSWPLSLWGGGGWPESIPRVGLNFQLKSWP